MRLNRSDIEVDVVIPGDGPQAKAVRRKTAEHCNIHPHGSQATLAFLIARADLAIGASGTTSWERLCLGLPALVITSGENQRPIAGELQAQGLIRWLGHHDEVDELTIARALAELLQRGADKDWSLRCRTVIDGKGVDRVCAALTVDASTPLRARRAKLADEELLRSWFGDPTNDFRNQPRDLDGCRVYMVETADGVAVAKVQFERSAKAWNVQRILAPFYSPLLDRAVFRSLC